MTARSCPGCGALFQQIDQDLPGYLAPELAGTEGNPVCRRCYRLRHYGRAEGRPLAPTKAMDQIRRALEPANAIIVLTDLADFDGSLPPRGLLPADKPVILAINKMDLLPPRAAAKEVAAWARERWQTLGRGPAARVVIPVSAAKGAGLAELAQEMQRYGGHQQVAAILGATSTGKSTLLKRFLAGTGAAQLPTVSRFPGTTQAATRWHLERLDLTLYDTPGFVPGNRLGDLLPPDDAANLVADRALVGKLFGINSQQALVFGGLAAFVLESAEPRTFLGYASDRVILHRTGAVKAAQLLADRPEWLLPWGSEACRSLRAGAEHSFELGAGEDLVLAGLGWISLRGGPARVRVLYPEGVALTRRPALFGPRPGITRRAKA